MESSGFSSHQDFQAGPIAIRHSRTREDAFGAGHDICQQRDCCARLTSGSKSTLCCSTTSLAAWRRDTRTGHHHWCNEACISADWALNVALLLDGGTLGTLPQRWVIQFLLFLRHPQRMATSARRAASQLTPCLDVHKPQQPFEPNLAFFPMTKGKYLAV